jgi:hypothetical protein
VVSVPAGSKATFEMTLGPAMAFKTKSEVKVDVTVLGFSVSETQDMEGVKGTDFGGIVGAGFHVPAGSVNLLLDGRWTFGLTSIDDSADEGDLKNSAFSFAVGLGFPLAGPGA